MKRPQFVVAALFLGAGAVFVLGFGGFGFALYPRDALARDALAGVMMSSVIYTALTDRPAVLEERLVERAHFTPRHVVMTDDLWSLALRRWLRPELEVAWDDYPDDAWDWIIDLNVTSTLLPTQYAVKAMIKGGRGGKVLNLSLGFSHPIDYAVPEGITIETPSQTEIVVAGADRQRVGQVAAEIRAYRPPEPYKGKGIRYVDEHIVRKAGKAATK